MKTRRTKNLVTVALACMVVFIATNAQAADPLGFVERRPGQTSHRRIRQGDYDSRQPSVRAARGAHCHV